MSAFWHPLSAVYLDEPRVLASPAVLRLILAGEGRAVVRYAGDRMWPTLRHGQAVQVLPMAGRRPEAGEVVLIADEGVMDLLRVFRTSPAVELVADAESQPARSVAERDLLGRTSFHGRDRGARGWRRLRLDLAEAWTGRPEIATDPAESVRDKYDEQSVHYARLESPPFEEAFAARVAAEIPRGGRVLVAGSGTGREAFALEEMGYEMVGVDFSPRMVERARAAAAARGSKTRFAARDLREHEEPEGSLAGVVFTYDVYSFLPSAASRRRVLAWIRRALVPGGALFLSARRCSGLGEKAILSLQWLASAAEGARKDWGDSHTRWLDASGRLRRSFVHVFRPGALDRELRRAGFDRIAWAGGHGLYRSRAGAAR